MNPQCIICQIHFKPSDYLYSTYCGHVFHYHCLSNWLGRSPTCPQCRQQTNNQQMLRLWLNDGGLNTSFTDEVGELKKVLDAQSAVITQTQQEIKDLQNDIQWRDEEISKLEKNLRLQQVSHAKKIKNFKSRLNRCRSEKAAALRDLKEQKSANTNELAVRSSSSLHQWPQTTPPPALPTYWQLNYQPQYQNYYYRY